MNRSLVLVLMSGAIALPLTSLPAQAATPTPMQVTPNLTLPIARAAGECPAEIGLWQEFRYYEGGREHTLILNTPPLAGPAEFADSGDRFVIFSAPLQAAYQSCVGWVVAPQEPYYNIWLQFGHVYFRFDLDAVPNAPASEITYQTVVNGLPYLRWAIAD